MRVRTLIVIASLLLPADSSAQRRFPVPRTGSDPARPVPLTGRQPEPIARALAYRRLRLSIESYPLISHVRTPGFTSDGRGAAWSAFGGGTRAEYRITRFVSATMDLTSSMFGSPVHVQTAELGTRIRPERTESRFYPFVDARVGYVSAYNTNLGSFSNDPYAFPALNGNGARYSRGFGAVAGVGMEYTLTSTISLTSGASVLRSSMSAEGFDSSQPIHPHFALTAYRYMLGIKYNPVRLVMP
jgi:hypothetical protein